MKIFFSVGEPSGDVHGANLIRAFQNEMNRRNETETAKGNGGKPEPLEICGFGGPKMRQAGCQLMFDLTQLAVMWVGRVLWNIRKFFQLADQAEEYFKKEKPDAVILIDYPGFNWHVAKRAHNAGIPVYYYSPPQIWGWAQWRVKKMRKWVDCTLSGLQFEADWLNEKGCRCIYVGHPFFDEVVRYQLDENWLQKVTRGRSLNSFRQFEPFEEGPSLQSTGGNEQSATENEEGEAFTPLIGILPGSRTQEVQSNLTTFLAAARIIAKQFPKARFFVAAFREKHRERIQPLVDRSGLKIEVYVGKTPEIMAAADVVMSVSGSVSLELLYYLKPTVMLYRVSQFGLFIQRFFRQVKYITLVNLLRYGAVRLNAPDSPSAPAPQEALFPEYLTSGDASAAIAKQLTDWLSGKKTPDSLLGAEFQRRLDALSALRNEVCQPGAADKAAKLILSEIAQSAETAHLTRE